MAMRTIIAYLCFCFTASAFANLFIESDESTSDGAYQLAQNCYAIQSPGSGQYLTKIHNSPQPEYQFQAVDAEKASRFFFKPSALGEFLLTDSAGDYLGHQLSSNPVAITRPSLKTQWKISAKGNTFFFHNQHSQRQIQHHYTQLIKWWFFSWKESKTETAFNLVARDDCRAYPEMTLAAWPQGEPHLAENHAKMAEKLKQNPAVAVRGFVDAHSHMTSYEFLGGKALPGDLFHRYGVAHALDSCFAEHGFTGTLDLIGGEAKAHNTTGWPDFPDWPAFDSKGHSAYYYRWIERAHLSGLRMMVVYLVENQVLCNIQGAINPVSWTGGTNSCNTMDSLFLQIQRVHEVVNYVDAQHGGPGKGFMRIVTSPQQAREVMAEGKLALLLGVEASEVLNCGKLDKCDSNKVDEQLDALYNAGVRVMYPVHKFDNHFGGTSLQNGLVHLGQKISTGYYFRSEDCDTHAHHYHDDLLHGLVMESGIPGVPMLQQEVLQKLVNFLGPQYPEDIEQCNRLGLTDLGAYLVNRMIDKKMIIDMDHLSGKAAAQVMDIVSARNYSGVVSTHGWMLRGKDQPGHSDILDNRPHATFNRLVAAGGFVAPMNKDSDLLIPDIEEYLLARMAVKFPQYSAAQLRAILAQMEPSQVPGVGIGVDMGGLATMANPKNKNPGYPFVTEFGVAFDRQGEAGKRRFDLAIDGVAHYGMLADHVAQVREDARASGKPYVYDALMNSAEAYLRMWERAEQ